MCIPIGVEWKCTDTWRGWFLCKPAGCDILRTRKDGLPPAFQYPKNTALSYRHYTKASQTLLKPAWCCSPACCSRAIADKVGESYAKEVRKHFTRCLPRFGEGLGKLNCMRAELGQPNAVDGLPFINTSLMMPKTLENLPWDEWQAYKDALVEERSLLSDKFNRSAKDQYRQLKFCVLQDPEQNSHGKWQPDPQLVAKFRNNQAQHPGYNQEDAELWLYEDMVYVRNLLRNLDPSWTPAWIQPAPIGALESVSAAPGDGNQTATDPGAGTKRPQKSSSTAFTAPPAKKSRAEAEETQAEEFDLTRFNLNLFEGAQSACNAIMEKVLTFSDLPAYPSKAEAETATITRREELRILGHAVHRISENVKRAPNFTLEEKKALGAAMESARSCIKERYNQAQPRIAKMVPPMQSYTQQAGIYSSGQGTNPIPAYPGSQPSLGLDALGSHYGSGRTGASTAMPTGTSAYLSFPMPPRRDTDPPGSAYERGGNLQGRQNIRRTAAPPGRVVQQRPSIPAIDRVPETPNRSNTSESSRSISTQGTASRSSSVDSNRALNSRVNNRGNAGKKRGGGQPDNLNHYLNNMKL